MVQIDSDQAFTLERFAYSRLGSVWGVARLMLSLDERHAAPLEVSLAALLEGEAVQFARAGACRTERRLENRTADARARLLWRGAFALPLTVLDDPHATFTLVIDGADAGILPAPELHRVFLRELHVSPQRDRRPNAPRISRGAYAAAATTAVTAAAGIPLVSPSIASAKSSTGSSPSVAQVAAAVEGVPVHHRGLPDPTVTQLPTSSPTLGSTSAGTVTRTVPTRHAATHAPSAPPTSTDSHDAPARPSSATSSTTCRGTTGMAAVAGAQSIDARRSTAPSGCTHATHGQFDIHLTHLSGEGAHQGRHITTRTAPRAPEYGVQGGTSVGIAQPGAVGPAAEKRRIAAELRAAQRHRVEAQRRAAARHRALELQRERREHAARERQEQMVRRQQQAAQRSAIATRIHAAALRAAARHATTPTSGGGITVSLPPGFRGPSSWTGVVSSNPGLGATVGNLSGLSSEWDRPPSFLVPIYMQAARRYHVPWEVLAAINSIESDYGRDLDTSSAGAIGWMQFEPGTWREYGVAADGVSEPNPYDPRDAIFAAARYLRAAGGGQDIRGAVFAYNHAGWYVDEVMSRAETIAAHAQYARAEVTRRGEVTVDFATDVAARPRISYSGGFLSHFDRLIAAANMVSAADFPYRWGGGHEQPARFGPFDCSGSVSYVMQQAGFDVPTTVAADVGGWDLPAGPGRVTIFYDAVHTFMRIGDRFFGTSGFARPGGGAGWFDVNRLPVAYLSQFHEVHVPDLGTDSFSATPVVPLAPIPFTGVGTPARDQGGDLAAARLDALSSVDGFSSTGGLSSVDGIAPAAGLVATGTAARRAPATREMLRWLVARGEQLLETELR